MSVNIIDFDECITNERNGTYGGQAGLKEGITYDNAYWLVKYPKSTKGMRVEDISYTTSPLSEYIGSNVYKILGYDVHETILGYRNGKIVVACKDFCEKEGSLREVRVLKNTYNEELERILEVEIASTGSDRIVDLKEILIHIRNNPILSKIENLEDRFWDCVIIDGLINNNDRNNGNWGLLYKDGEYELAPIYDNGAAFSGKLSDARIEKRLKNKESLRQSSILTETAYGINDSKLKFKDILEIDEQGLRKAIKRNGNLITEKMKEIEEFIISIPEKYKEIPIISKERKEFYIESMKIRLEEIIMPAYERILETEIKVDKKVSVQKNKVR